MPTVNQLLRKKDLGRSSRNKVLALEQSPQKRCLFESLYYYLKTKLALRKSCQRVESMLRYFIPGEGHNLQEHQLF